MTSMDIDLKDFDRFISAVSSGRFSDAIRGATLQVANEWMAKAQNRTQTVSSLMKQSWHVDDLGYTGNDYRARVFNSAVGEKGAPYPIYVEYGHRQEVGRFVPAIGKRLVRPWVKGQFMLTNSRVEMQDRVPKIIAAHIKKAWDEI